MPLDGKRRRNVPHAPILRPAIVTALLLGGGACSFRTALDAQRDLASELTPDVPARPAARREVEDIVRVRAYLDEDYRSQNLHAEERVRATIAQASLHLTEALGLAFEVVDVVPWARRGPDLEAALEELKRTDAGDGIDFVVEFVTASPQWTASLHALGRAHVLGRHAVIRGMNDVEERRALEKALPLLSRDEREEVYRARRLHKEVSVLLHEWGHTVGGMHVPDPEDFMNPQHDVEQHRFATSHLAVLALGARWHRARDDDERREIAAELDAALNGDDAPAYAEEARHAVLAVVAPYLTAGPRPAGEGVAPSSAVQPTRPGAALAPHEREAFDAAARLVSSGDLDAAWPRLRPLVERYPEDGAIQRLGCVAGQRQSVLAAGREAPCRRAVALEPRDPLPPLVLAKLALDSRNVDEGARWAEEAGARLESNAAGDSSQWLQLAFISRALRRVTDAERAARRVSDEATAREIEAWAATTRRRFGMPEPPAPGSIEREHDAAYLGAVDDVYLALGKSDVKGAARACDEGLARFGDVPGLLALRCQVDLRAGRVKAAASACARALELYEEATIAHVAAAMLAYRQRREEDALRHGRRAVELDPTHAPTWELLAQLYRRFGRSSELSALEADYQARFGRPLARH